MSLETVGWVQLCFLTAKKGTGRFEISEVNTWRWNHNILWPGDRITNSPDRGCDLGDLQNILAAPWMELPAMKQGQKSTCLFWNPKVNCQNQCGTNFCGTHNSYQKSLESQVRWLPSGIEESKTIKNLAESKCCQHFRTKNMFRYRISEVRSTLKFRAEVAFWSPLKGIPLRIRGQSPHLGSPNGVGPSGFLGDHGSCHLCNEEQPEKKPLEQQPQAGKKLGHDFVTSLGIKHVTSFFNFLSLVSPLPVWTGGEDEPIGTVSSSGEVGNTWKDLSQTRHEGECFMIFQFHHRRLSINLKYVMKRRIWVSKTISSTIQPSVQMMFSWFMFMPIVFDGKNHGSKTQFHPIIVSELKPPRQKAVGTAAEPPTCLEDQHRWKKTVDPPLNLEVPAYKAYDAQKDVVHHIGLVDQNRGPSISYGAAMAHGSRHKQICNFLRRKPKHEEMVRSVFEVKIDQVWPSLTGD